MRVAIACVALCSASMVVGTAAASVLTSFSGGSIAPGTSSYFVSPTMTPAGSYNVVTLDTLHPSWADFFDHTTGDAAGSFMVVNGGAGVGGGMAWSATVSVTPGTDYTVSAWFASVYGFATSTLRFVVVGDTTLTGPGFGAPTVTATWAQSSYTFNTGTSTAVSLQIWDISGLSDGNDYAIDDIALDVVPTPGAAGLLAFGSVAALRRRRA